MPDVRRSFVVADRSCGATYAGSDPGKLEFAMQHCHCQQAGSRCLGARM
jgi:hypothetical protein